jgi:hypothetical protein
MNPFIQAQQCSGFLGPITCYLNQFIGFINNILVPVVFALAFLMFLWGIFNYYFAGEKGDTSKTRDKGKDFILWGVVAFFVMLSVWGLVNLLVDTAGLPYNTNRPTPEFIPYQNRGPY